MKKYNTYLLPVIILCCFINTGFCQSRLILNGAKINIRNGASLVINNSAANAITRYNGHIISEGENNNIKWCLGTTTGDYIIPLGYQTTDYIPLTFTNTAGTGNGYFNFSTYHTGWNNSAYLPTGVLNVSYNGMDNSPFTIDRFWQIDAGGYTTKPSLLNLTFTYLDAEWTASGNNIFEDQMGAQRWNPTINDWGDFIPGVNIDIVNNKITVPTVSAANLYKWWTLPALNGNHALPVELTSFKGACNNGNILLVWSTASEFNNKFFMLERSQDGNKWTAIATVNGAGNSSVPQDYSFSDRVGTEKNYYRLKQVDVSGKETYSKVIEVSCTSAEPLNTMQVYPNPSSGLFTVQNVAGDLLQIINAEGKMVFSGKSEDDKVNIDLQDISNGIYTIIATNSLQTVNAKIIIQH